MTPRVFIDGSEEAQGGAFGFEGEEEEHEGGQQGSGGGSNFSAAAAMSPPAERKLGRGASGRDNNNRNSDQYKELADAVSPSARIDDRCEALRTRCSEGLGKIVFEDAYEFLKKLQHKSNRRNARREREEREFMSPGGTHMEAGGEDDWSASEEEGGEYSDGGGGADDSLEESGDHDEERVLRHLTSILGETNLSYWSLVDQLLFCEELRDQNRIMKGQYDE